MKAETCWAHLHGHLRFGSLYFFPSDVINMGISILYFNHKPPSLCSARSSVERLLDEAVMTLAMFNWLKCSYGRRETCSEARNSTHPGVSCLLLAFLLWNKRKSQAHVTLHASSSYRGSNLDSPVSASQRTGIIGVCHNTPLAWDFFKRQHNSIIPRIYSREIKF